MTTFEQTARAEAERRYDGDRIIDENTGEWVSHDDWGYAEGERRAFVAGASWLAEHDRVAAERAWDEGYGPDEECHTPRRNAYRKEQENNNA